MKALIAAFSLLAPTTQPAASPPCIHPAEIEHATLFVVPPLLDGLAEQCRASLAPNAYLLTGATELSKRLTADRAVHWERTRGAFVRVAGDEKAAAFSADTASSFLRDMIKMQGAKDLTPENCATLDRALGLLSPLPPENIAGLIILAMERGMAPPVAPASKKVGAKSAKAPPRPILCPASSPRP